MINTIKKSDYHLVIRGYKESWIELKLYELWNKTFSKSQFLDQTNEKFVSLQTCGVYVFVTK
jgi:hypothetical protein